MPSRYSLRTLLPAVILVALIATGLGAGYYTSARPSSPRITWTTNPLFITFSSQPGSGSLPDSFTCNPPVAPVTLIARSNQPDIITLTVNPPGFSRCGSVPDNLVVTATCTLAAQASNTCPGDFSGKVSVCGPTPYTCLQRTLNLVINVSNTNNI
jgi:hypothetical protein